MAQFIDFGSGREGALNIGASNLGGIDGFGVATVTGTAGQYSCVKSDVGYFNGSNGGRNGDMVLIHQSTGTGAGQWEINYIVSTSGTTVNLSKPLSYTYVAGAQMYTSPQLNGGTISGNLAQYSSWNGSSGGIIFLVDKGTLTISGTIKVDGVTGGWSGIRGTGGGATGGGFRGGNGKQFAPSATYSAYQGESQNGTGSASSSANGVAGGGGYVVSESYNGAGGGGGGNTSSGGNGGFGGVGSGNGGYGGNASGNAALTLMLFGGGGGGAINQDSGSDRQAPGGSSGGGIVLIIAKNINITGSISVNGGNGLSSVWRGGGGAGAGGSVLIKTQVATLGTNKITASGGSASTAENSSGGGAGSVGRIRCDYLTSVSGSTTPTLSSAQDSSLIVPSNNFFAFF